MAKVRLYEAAQSAKQIGANSIAFANGGLVALVTGFLVRAINTTLAPIVGVSNSTQTMSATNQTVEFVEQSYTRFEPYDTRFDYTTSAAIVQADVGKFYALTAGGLVDVATASATKAAGSVVRLEDVVGSTTGTFVVTV